MINLPGVKNLYIPARSYGGTFRDLGVCIHSIECPLRAGYAESIARNWFATQAPTSAHFCVDPVAIVQQVPLNVRAWHCGNGNPYVTGLEQTGYARYSRGEWTTPDGMTQLRNLAALTRAILDRQGAPLRIASAAEARSAAYMGRPIGIITHDTARVAWGGTTHTDPMPHYPLDLLLDHVRDGATPQPVEVEPETKDDTMKIIRNNDSGACYLVGEHGYKQIASVSDLRWYTAVYGDYVNLPGGPCNRILEAATARRAELVKATK